jgi:hypothetical protein
VVFNVTELAHMPPEQVRPAVQAAPPPHVQAPAAEQPSAVAPQVTHDAPPAPQAAEAVPGWQRVPSQQPPPHCPGPEQLLAHMPPEQTLPIEQAAAPPHVQVPVAEQPSALLPQLTHAEPPVPQALVSSPG